MKKELYVVPTLFLLFVFGCKDNTIERQETSFDKKLERKYEKAQDFTFTNWALKDNDSVKQVFKKNFSSAELHTIAALNRVDKNTVHTIDTLAIPDKFDDDFLAYSPFPYTISEAK